MFNKIKRETIFNIVYYGVFLLVMYILQASVFPWFAPGAVPLLLVIACAGLSHFADSGTGAVLGLCCGILCDVALGRPTVVCTVILTVIGLVMGYLGETIFSRRFPSYMLCCIAAVMAVSFVQMFEFLFFEDVPFFRLIATAALQTLTSCVCAVPLYPIIKKLSSRRYKK